jgi:hypothetical protein
MKTYIAVFAAAMLTSPGFGAGVTAARATGHMGCEGHSCCRPPAHRTATLGDPYAEERFRMKYGRNNPAEEARQKAAQAFYAKNMLNCERHGCAGGSETKPNAAAMAEVKGDPNAELRFRMKYGRNTPAEEARQKAAQTFYAESMRNCEGQGCGGSSEPKPNAAAMAEVKGNPSAELRFRKKYGRNSPAEERRLARAKEPAKTVELASADRMICEPGCCDHTP